ncbi:MAG: hypothetical protein PF549_03185 [Patescibacteria group bacterium]|nr:hypothetical protein [Patescibacteria group bacterium]
MIISAIEKGDKGKIERCRNMITGSETVKADFHQELELVEPEKRKLIFAKTNLNASDFL